MKKMIVCLVSGVCLATTAAWQGLQSENAVTPTPIVTASVAAAETPAPPEPEEFLPLPFPTGYSGTAGERGDTPLPPPPLRESVRPSSSGLPGWGRAATDGQLPAVAAALSKAVRYDDCLARIHQLAGKATWRGEEYVVGAEPFYETRFQRDPERATDLMIDALDNSSGVARQNLIFQLAITLPDELSFPKLNSIRAGSDPADAEDALCALAFRGDPAAMAEFEALAARHCKADCNILCDSVKQHDKFAQQGKRGLLRSYRCIEVLDFRPYFQLHSWSFRRGAGEEFTWASKRFSETVSQRRETAKHLLPCWIKRFHMHPGSDDMAWRMSKMCCEDEQWLEGARWASRCATFPDQDMTACGLEMLTSLAECVLEEWQLDDLVSGPEWERNRQLLLYIRLRRMAAEFGFSNAVERAAFYAQHDAGSVIGRCFKARWATEPPKGLSSGLVPLPRNDPLRRVEGTVPREQRGMNPVNRWAGSWHLMTNRGYTRAERRLNPPSDAVELPTARLARQFRLWETIAELEQRKLTAEDPADMEYKIAAVFYHNRDVVFPVYAKHQYNSALPISIKWYLRTNSQPYDKVDTVNFASWRRSAELFESLADNYPYWPGRDKAAFSAAMSWIKLADYRPLPGGHEAIRKGVAMFERMQRDHATSTLCDDAERASGYWRRYYAHIFEPDE